MVLRRLLIITLFPCIVSSVAESGKPSQMEQTIESIRDCIDSSPAPWPYEWKKEYIETIRKAVELHHNAAHYTKRLEILHNGFVPYWDGFKKTDERSLFEVHRTQIRWYVEHLMNTEFPMENERQKLCNQYKDLWNYAADSLLKQFPFLDPNAVQNAKKNDLSKCYHNIEAPLMPAYLKPMSEEQVAQIKQRWEKLRYIRVDLWRRLDDGSKTPAENRDATLSNAELDYELTQKSLSQLLGQVWMVVSKRPDYYISALKNHSRTIQDRLKSFLHPWILT